MGPTRLPTAEELAQLSELFRRDPGSRAGADLGNAYLALGRPSDAIDVASKALKANPQNIDGRIMVSRAFMALHRWKEAQIELLKVVKSDRNHRDGFRLLGEVLMRRSDFGRALPVLQHAQTLEPADRGLLAMLKRARSGQPLDPPPPIPSPRAPGAPAQQAAGGPIGGPTIQMTAGSFEDEETRQVDAAAMLDSFNAGQEEDRPTVMMPTQAPPGVLPGQQPSAAPASQVPPYAAPTMQPGAAPPMQMPPYAAPTMQVPAGAAPPMQAPPPAAPPMQGVPPGAAPPMQGRPMQGRPGAPPMQGPPMQGPPGAPPMQGPPMQGPPMQGAPPMQGPPMQGPPMQGAPPAAFPPGPGGPGPGPAKNPAPMAPSPSGGAPKVRPRVWQGQKPRDAAQASLRQSAAVGEDYLNQLLTHGLLQVPNVRAPELSFDVKPESRWGRSARRMFVYLFVLLVIGTGAGGAWYYYSARQQVADVSGHIARVSELLHSASYKDVQDAIKQASAAISRDKSSLPALAAYAEAAGIDLLVYRDVSASKVAYAIQTVAKDINAPDKPGYRDLIAGNAALVIATLPHIQRPVARLAAVIKRLDGYLKAHPDDSLMRWLEGRAMLAAGERASARDAFKRAYAGGKGTAQAGIDLADMALDDGDFDRASALYKDILSHVKGDPFAIVGESMVISERSGEPADALGDLSVGLATAKAPRVLAYKQLATAEAQFLIEKYVDFGKALDKAVGGAMEPRFMARVALGRIAQGRVTDAAKIRGKITWYGNGKPEPQPVVATLDAELLLARGLPDAAVSKLKGVPGLMAERVRGRALLFAGRAQEAAAELAKALKVAPDDADATIWAQAARLLTGDAKARTAASNRLDSLGREAPSKLPRYAEAFALLGNGDNKAGRNMLEMSLKDVSAEQPNPLAYRAHTDLAQLYVQAGESDQAMKQLKAALKQNPAYLPAHDLLGQLLVATGDDSGALDELGDVIHANAASARGELAFAQATMASNPDDKARQAAAAAVKRASQKGAPKDDVARVAALVDPALPGQLGLKAPKSAKKSEHHHHHH